MERRDWSLEALNQLQYIDSLDDSDLKAKSISSWVSKYLMENSSIEDFQLDLPLLKRLEELLFKNIAFMKTYQSNMKKELDDFKKIKKFLQ